MKLVCTLHSFTPKVTLVERFLEMFMCAYQLLCFNSHMSWHIFIVSLSLSLSVSRKFVLFLRWISLCCYTETKRSSSHLMRTVLVSERKFKLDLVVVFNVMLAMRTLGCWKSSSNPFFCDQVLTNAIHVFFFVQVLGVVLQRVVLS